MGTKGCGRIASLAATVLWPFLTRADVPHNQDVAPGPALSAEAAVSKMTLPAGLEVRLYASEPAIVNPIAMTFDAKGRVWLLESLEYPRLKAGPGQDRVKILEDSDGDGVADVVRIFADDLNIPSGIAVGSDGVFVANSPDLLFLRDTDGDDVADSREVLLTGFGRADTHELPSCLTWGPDGWLYGLNGVFNPSVIHHQGKTHRFTCALWRYHPTTRKFEVFCEGTSNPWGLDYDEEGSFFVSACVIDHLWHFVETGYYHRQAGAYPPHTWKIESIVNHAHQKAAYCGLCWFDSPALGGAHSGKWLMGNIHGSCLNADRIERNGASYKGRPDADFLSAHDAWFMPVSQKVGPDGALWVLDWYDRYHCYQDARRDAAGIDRARGRIYRIVPKDSPPLVPLDLSRRTSKELVDRLSDPNVSVRRTARRLLVERRHEQPTLEQIALDSSLDMRARLEALWARVSQGEIPPSFLHSLMRDPAPQVRAWGVRAAGDAPHDPQMTARIREMTHDGDVRVRLQVAIASRKVLADPAAIDDLLSILAGSLEDPSGLLARVAWRNLEPLIVENGPTVVETLRRLSKSNTTGLDTVIDRVVSRMLDAPESHREATAETLTRLISADSTHPSWRRATVQALFEAARSKQVSSATVQTILERCQSLDADSGSSDDSLRVALLGLAMLTGRADAATTAQRLLESHSLPPDLASELFSAWAFFARPEHVEAATTFRELLRATSGPSRMSLLLTARGLSDPMFATAILDAFDRLSPDERGPALNVLAGRVEWARLLIDAIEANRFPRESLNANQLRLLLQSKDPEVLAGIERIWGRVRNDDDPKDRQILAAKMRRALDAGEGDPDQGKLVYERVCSQCHRLRDQGHEVGPELSRNGTADLDALCSNVFDPNLIIGKAYEARVIATVDGQIVTGLVIEESPRRVVLKIAGGQSVSVPRDEIEQMRRSDVSLMPEGLESQMSEQQFRDLVAFLRRETTEP